MNARLTARQAVESLALLAQLVARGSDKAKVIGSSPVESKNNARIFWFNLTTIILELLDLEFLAAPDGGGGRQRALATDCTRCVHTSQFASLVCEGL